MSTASETSDASLSTKATLAGLVDINFKSDYFPLEKMADSFQIGKSKCLEAGFQATSTGRGQHVGCTGSGSASCPQPAATPAPAAGTPAK